MSVYGGPTPLWIGTRAIVTDGLVLNLNAGVKQSYSGSGTTWFDLSGRNNNGTLVSTPTFSTLNGGAFILNGSSQYVTVPTSTNWNFGTGDFTIDMWIYPTSYSSTTNNPTLLAINPYYDASPNGIMICLNASGNLTLFTNSVFTSNVTAPLNRWTHCIFTRVSGTLRMYAQAVASQTFDFSTFSITNSANMSIGYDFSYSTDFFIGSISCVKIYSKGFSASEVSQNFNALRGRFGI